MKKYDVECTQFPHLGGGIVYQCIRINIRTIGKTIYSSVADPDPRSGTFLTPGSGIGKKSRYGSGMNIPDHISESLDSIF
jgi:hypothetical protein